MGKRYVYNKVDITAFANSYNFPIPDYKLKGSGFTADQVVEARKRWLTELVNKQSHEYRKYQDTIKPMYKRGLDLPVNFMEYLYLYSYTRLSLHKIAENMSSRGLELVHVKEYVKAIKKLNLTRVDIHDWVVTEIEVLHDLLSGYGEVRYSLIKRYLPHRNYTSLVGTAKELGLRVPINDLEEVKQ